MFLMPRLRASWARSSLSVKSYLDSIGPVIKPSRHSKRLISAKHPNNFQFARFITCSRVYCEEATTKPNSTDFQVDDSASAFAEPSKEFIENLSAESLRLFQILRLEFEVIRQSGYQVPEKISDAHWAEILNMKSKLGRIKFYRFLCITEYSKKAKQEKKAARRLEFVKMLEEREKLKVDQPFDGYEYGLNKNTIFIRLSQSSENEFYNTRLCQSIMFGRKLIIDMGYEKYMTRREMVSCADQITFVMHNNRQNRDPFNIYFCNLAQGSELHRCLLKSTPNLHENNCLFNVTEKSYLELFPMEKLVYLTPDCKNNMDEYEQDSIYIIGGLVDKRPTGPLSLAKAKKEGLRMARLPVEKYLDWGNGNKSFTLDQMLIMLLEIKNTGDWNKAFMHVPKRKLRKSTDEIPFDRRQRNERLFGPR